MNPLQQQIDALQATVAALAARMQALEAHAAGATTTGDPMGSYTESIQERLQKGRQEHGSNYALAITSIVSQSNNSGHSGTACGLVIVDHADELASDEDIEAKAARVRLFVTDTLVLRCFREFVALWFEGKPAEATAAVLAGRLGTDTARIDAVLDPLVQNETLRRGLRTDGTPFYEWSGNDHLPMSLLA